MRSDAPRTTPSPEARASLPPQQVPSSRQAAPPPRVLHLDVLRGLSILMVLFHHQAAFPGAHGWLYAPVVVLNRIGWSGVDIFFVLSGFLVGGLLMREWQETGSLLPARFLARRAFKVWPTYFVFLGAYFLVRTLVPNETGATAGARAAYLLKHHWSNLLQVQNYFASSSDLGWLWSLAVEEHFYLLLPWALLTILGSHRSSATRTHRVLVAFFAVGLGCMLARWAASHHYDRETPSSYALVFPSHLRMDALFCGVVLAYFARFHQSALKRLEPFRHVFLVLGCLSWLPFVLASNHEDQLFLYPLGMTLLSTGAAALVLFAHLSSHASAAERVSPVGRVFRVLMQGMAWLGVRSYAIYVWHGYFAKPFAHRAVVALGLSGAQPGLGGWLHDAIYLLADVGIGALMFALVEAPSLRLRAKLVPATTTSVP